MSKIINYDEMVGKPEPYRFILGGKTYEVPDFSEARLQRLAVIETKHDGDDNPYPSMRAKLAALTDQPEESFDGVQIDALLLAVADISAQMTEAAVKNGNRRSRRNGRGR